MRHPSTLGDLTPDEWEYLQDKLDRFEQAWQQTGPADLTRFLPPRGDRLRSVALGEFIKTELEIRWRKEEAAVLEDYLKRFPELAEDDTLLVQLVYEEFMVRHRHGDKPQLASYRGRFPQQFEELARLVQDQFPTAAALVPLTAAPSPGQSRPEAAVVSAVAGGYILRKRIGAGSFGEVWRAEAPGGVDVAVKIIIRPLDHAEVQRELESLELIKRLRHPFLLQTQAFWSSEDRLFIAMELADGSLRDRLRECYQDGLPGIPPEELLSYFREAAEALDYLHDKQVLHRDIKPDNILLLARHAKVGDFGLARMLEQQRSFTATSSGTPPYTAPEVWRGRGSRHSDQYSLAAAYAELRLNRRVFGGGDMMEIMLQHVEEKPNLDPLPEAEQQVLHKALAKKPAERYASCLEFWRRLRQALGAEGGSAPRFPVAEQIPQKDRAASSEAIDRRAAVPTKESRLGATPVDLSQGEEIPATARPGVMPVLADTTPLVDSVAPPAATEERPTVVALATATDHLAAPRRRLLWGAVLLLAGAVPIGLIVWLGLPPAVRLTPEVDFLPEHYQRAEQSKIVRVADKKLYDRMRYLLPDQTPVLFLLIPQDKDTDPAPFYIMQDKVSNRFFRAFAAAQPAAVANSHWEIRGLQDGPKISRADDEMPVFGVTLVEAHEFARWLGGSLPTTRQWDKAAGAFDGAKGPFRGEAANFEPGDFALRRRVEDGAMPVGTHPRDISLFECRDMAANGREWTVIGADPDPKNERRVSFASLNPAQKVRLRGHSYEEDKPYQFGDEPDEHPANSARPDIGFRVVIELPFLR